MARPDSIRPAEPNRPTLNPRRVGIWHLAVTFVITVLISGMTIVVVRRLSVAPLAANAPATGNLTINTSPDGSDVVVDGERRGVTPLTVALASGSHTMIVRGAGHERVVSLAIKAGADVNHYIEMKAPEPPVRGEAAMVTAPTAAPVRSKIAPIRIDPPKVAVSINVRPWADVFVDGHSVGQTPIWNLLVPIGSHDVVFRHPRLGERKQTVVVSADGPNRFAADFSK